MGKMMKESMRVMMNPEFNKLLAEAMSQGQMK